MFEEVSKYFLEVLQGVNLGHVFRCLGRGRPDPGQDLHAVRVDVLTRAEPYGDSRLRGHFHLLLGLFKRKHCTAVTLSGKGQGDDCSGGQ